MTTLKADSKRILEEFQELTSVDCISFQERAIADRLKKKLTALGFTVEEDDAGEFYGSDTGNLYGYLPGTLPGPPILLSAHMDTVEPGCGKKAVVHEDGRITSAGDTILGADDVCGLVEILEGIRILKEQGIPHRAVEVLFPVAEELFIKGTNRFDFGRIRAKEAYVLDLSNEVGTAALRAPSLISFCINVKGKS
ncbi:MAG: M20/M25/M40 family metallo-hydrolase, partial [Blautia sp.]|nr:M20/M25/M40 family metallo-hydrolase [Blautia sp.]